MRRWSKGRRSQKRFDAVIGRSGSRLSQGASYAAIVTLIGGDDSFTVSTNPAHAHTVTSYPLPAEMTATGEIVDGKPHIHAVMARPRQAQMKSEPPSTFTVAPVTYPFR
jgi:hypothetical protein